MTEISRIAGRAAVAVLSTGWSITRRLSYVVLFLLFGLAFAIPKWILMGTRGSRERKKLIKLQRRALKNQVR